MTYNILEGGVGRVDPLAEVVRLADADVVILQETWDAALFHKLADRLKMDRFLAENPRNKEGSTGLMTRLGIREGVNVGAVDARFSKSAFVATLALKLETGNTKRETGLSELAVMGVHLHHYETFADEAKRVAEVEAVLEWARGLPAEHVIGGDFNATHPGQVIDLAKVRAKTRERVAGQGNVFPREAIGKMLAAGYVDGHAVHHPPAEFDTSFTTAHPAMRVDYLFAPSALAGRVKSCDVFKPEMGRFASDHYPVVMEIE